MDFVDALARTYASLERVVAPLGPEDLARPTPCAEWTVRDVLNHLLAGMDVFTTSAREGTPPTPPARDADLAGDDPAGALRAAVAETVAAWRTPGAADRPARVLEGVHLIEIALADAALHTWDVAVAVGHDPELPPDVVDHLLQKLPGAWVEGGRQMGAFGPECEPPPDATPADRLAALTGRQQ